jgi:hypothetical protein
MTASLLACGAPFKVAPTLPAQLPVNTSTDTQIDAPSTQIATAGWQISAKQLDPDQIYDIFGGNLLLAGILPVQLTITNQTRESIDFRPQQCTLTVTNRQAKLLTPDQALARLVKYYGVRVYNIHFYDQMATRFTQQSLTAGVILPGATLQGMLYFATAANQPLPTAKGQLQIKLRSAAPLVFSLP